MSGPDKEEIRRLIKDRRRAHDSEWIERTSLLAQGEVGRLQEFEQARIVACYLAMPDEVQTKRILETSWARGKTVCVPAYLPDRKRYRFARFEKDDAVALGPAQVPEPARKDWIAMETVDLMIVPGLAFDPQGGRLGFGGGYYDRLLPRTTALRVGVTFDQCMAEELPCQEHDQRVDWVATPTRLIHCSPRGTAG